MRSLFLSILIALLSLAPVAALADVTKACDVVGSEINPTEAQATDDFINLVDGSTGTTQTGEDIFVAPVEMLASDLSATVDVAPGAGDSYVIYFVADGTRVGGLTCTIAGTGTTCSSGSDSALIAGGARLTLAVDTGEGAGDAAAAASIEVSACIRKN